MARLAPLPVDATPQLKTLFARQLATGSFIPNSWLVMQRKPKLVEAFRAMSAAVFDPDGEVSVGFKRLLAYVVARVHGCHY